MARTKLTDKQELFVQYYLQHHNATDAARRAGYSEKTAYSIGQENLKKPEIEARIAERVSEVAMASDEVLLRLGEQARGVHVGFWTFDANGRSVALNFRALLEAGYGHLVKEFECHELTGEVTKVKFYDAQVALKLLGTHHKLFTEKVEHSGKVVIEDDGITDTERFERLLALADAARARGSSDASAGAGGDKAG